eukprot:CAMPEP_0194382742 /NCGR_PEP_ID=MMETSP0174-20130528/62631_1 /TAXON_ID=216777 /ORGANISM="Proboscia alata, Strain PI-D3" /LENGTH=98 /DNA_ID=CAMNT_0039168315 /DNA_START=48 /DNA_END=340 /DNA_ORIENTATION=+
MIEFLLFLVVTTLLIATVVLCILRAMHSSIGLAKPSQQQLRDEPQNSCPLFSHCRSLSTQIAWRELGGTFPTPVHRCDCQAVSRHELAAADASAKGDT